MSLLSDFRKWFCKCPEVPSQPIAPVTTSERIFVLSIENDISCVSSNPQKVLKDLNDFISVQDEEDKDELEEFVEIDEYVDGAWVNSWFIKDFQKEFNK